MNLAEILFRGQILGADSESEVIFYIRSQCKTIIVLQDRNSRFDWLTLFRLGRDTMFFLAVLKRLAVGRRNFLTFSIII